MSRYLVQARAAHRIDEIEAAFDPGKRQEMIQRSGGRATFPQIFIDARHIGGCDEMMALERAETEDFNRLKAELQHAFAAPDDSYQPLDADVVIQRGRNRTLR